MRTLMAFIKKEWLEQIRSGKIVVLGIVFILLGIMNPAIAKLTPWMMEMLADSLAEAGMAVTEVQVDAMTSWIQFFKNIPIGLIAFVLMQSGIFTKEYQSGTLVLALTKGLKRWKIVAAKSTVLVILWTIYYWMSYAITYIYNAYFWDNGIVHHLGFATACWWLFGMWTIMLIVLFSCLMSSNTGVLAGTGCVFLGSYLAGLFPKIAVYVPTMLMDASSLIAGKESVDIYGKAIVVTVVLSVICVWISLACINKKTV